MDWSEPTIRCIYDGNLVGEDWPYAGGSKQDVETYLRSIVAYLSQSDLLTVEADFNSFGCGYASFVEVFCSKRDGSSTQRLGNGTKTEGLLVYLCRLAPVAAYGKDTRTRDGHGGTSGFLEPNTAGSVPTGEWDDALRELRGKLDERGFFVAEAPMLQQPLSFEYKIDTNLGEPPYCVFDVFFWWYD